jgi:flagellar biosynthetic protein FliR
LIPDKVPVDLLLSVLRLLLDERVSIRNLPLILEAIAEARSRVECRGHLRTCASAPGLPAGRRASKRPDGTIPLIQLAPEWEEIFQPTRSTGTGAAPHRAAARRVRALANGRSPTGQPRVRKTASSPALVTSGRRRRFLRTVMAAKGIPNPVLSFEEIGIDARPFCAGRRGRRMIPVLTALSDLAGPWLWSGLVVFLRVGAVAALAPAFGEQTVPARVRLAVALAFALAVLPAVAPLVPPPSGPLAVLRICGAEVIAGLTFGIVLRLMVMALQTAGSIAAQSISLAQMFAGTGPDPQPIVANLLVLAALALFVATGGLARAADLLAQSYQIVPPGQLTLAQGFTEWGLSRISSVFALAFTLAAPFVLAALLYNLALGAINRAMPQLMVSFVGAPALTLGGLALLALCTPFLLAAWQEAMQAALAQPFGG